MRITARQLRQIIKEELIRSNVLSEAIPVMVKGGAEVADFDPTDLIDRVTKRPLVMGSRGEDVATAQSYLVAGLRQIADRGIDLPIEDVRELRAAVGQDERNTNISALIYKLAEKIAATGPDGKFGPMTELATRIFQSVARVSAGLQMGQPMLKVDGKVGRETMIMLLKGFGTERPPGPDAESQYLEEALLRRRRAGSARIR